MKMNKKLLFICLALLTLCSLARFTDNTDYWIVDILSHFPAQYAFASLFLLAVCLWKKIIPLAVLAGFLFIINAIVLVDSGKLVQAAGQTGATFKVYSANIERSDKDFSRLTRELKETDPDIVLLIEITPGHVEQLKTLFASFPYHVAYTPFGKLNCGSAVLSKFPILDSQETQLTELGNLLVEVELDINNKKTMFYGLHAVNPSLKKYFKSRQKNYLRMADKVGKASMPVIIAGDFNATPYSPMFRRLLKASGLKDSRAGFGWQPSWPTSFPLFWLPIDHILVSSDFQVLQRTTGSYIGSDHYPVIAELSMPL